MSSFVITKSSETLISRRQFGQIAAGVAVGCLTFPSVLRSAASDKGVPQRRLNRLATGANVCRWFRFIGESPNPEYIPESEAILMQRMGRAVRQILMREGVYPMD